MCGEYGRFYYQEVKRRKKELRALKEANVAPRGNITMQLDSNQTTQHMCGGYNHYHNQEQEELKRKQKAEAKRKAEANQPKADTKISNLKREADEWNGGAANDGKARQPLTNSN